MKKKKWFSVLIIMSMLLAMIPTSAFAAGGDSITTVRDEESLKDTISQAISDQETGVTLGDDITLTSPLEIPAGKIIVLDLNGCVLSSSGANDVIDNNGILTIKNGTVATEDNDVSSQGMAVNNLGGATLTVTEDSGSKTKLIGRCGIQNHGTAKVYGGTIESYNRNAIWGRPNSVLYVYDGTVTSPTGSSGYGRAVSSEGDVNIYGGSFYSGGTSGAGDNYMNAIGIFNGAVLTIEPTEGKMVSVVSETDYAVSTMGNAKVIIRGGDFACNGQRADVMDFESGNVQIFGGTFKSQPYDEYLAENHAVVLENGKYAVKAVSEIQSVTAESYEELTQLLDGSILEPKAITLGADIEIPESADISLKKGYTLIVPEGVNFGVKGLLRLEGALVNNGILEVGNNGFIENPLNVTGKGQISDYPEVVGGVCEISTPMQLQWLSRMVELDNGNIPENIILTEDIILPDVKFTPIGVTEENLFSLSTFNGNGHKISNLNVVAESEYQAGLFGNVADATIKNLTIDGTSTTSTSSYIGALIGFATGSCSVKNVHIDNYTVQSPIGYGTGGFVGQIWTNDSTDKFEFINCSMNANVEGYANVGAFWGTSTGSKGTIGIYNCDISGTVNAINVNAGICGGFGNTATVQIIGLDDTGLTASVKGEETEILVSASTSSENDFTFEDAASYQAVKTSDGQWTAIGESQSIEAEIDGVPYATLEDAVTAAQENDVIVLLNDVEVDKKLDIVKDGITLDLNRHEITASDNFKFDSNNPNGCHLVDVLADNVTIKNGTLTATDGNKHTLNVYGAKGVTLQDLTIDHTEGVTGAPLVIGGSDVAISGNLNIITGANSWYGVNIDSRQIGGVSIGSNVSAAENANIVFQGENSVGIYAENTEESNDTQVVLTFEPNVKIESDIQDFTAVVISGNNEQLEDVTINNPENAGLDMGEDGISRPHTHVIEILNAKEASCTEEGYTGDKVCSVCGELIEKGQVIEKAAHDYHDGVCTVCGAEDPDYNPSTPGDNTGENQNDPSDSNSGNDNSGKTEQDASQIPETGVDDSSSLWMAVGLVSIMCACMIYIIAFSKRREE